jgi:hypothetical protein
MNDDFGRVLKMRMVCGVFFVSFHPTFTCVRPSLVSLHFLPSFLSFHICTRMSDWLPVWCI